MNILLVGRSPQLTTLAVDLTAAEHRPLFAPERGALATLRQNAFDAVVIAPDTLNVPCEIVLPKVRGAVAPHMPIVVLTESGSLANCRRCRVIDEYTDCVDAPADQNKVLAVIEQLQSKSIGTSATLSQTDYKLTPREKDVLRLMRLGLSNREIATRLFITEKVVEKHVAHLCEKLSAENRTQAVALSYRERVL
jgi:DNA-binding NarL/FixJ family response regulator